MKKIMSLEKKHFFSRNPGRRMRCGVIACLLVCLLLAAPAAAASQTCSACQTSDRECKNLCSDMGCVDCGCTTPDCPGGSPAPSPASGDGSEGYPNPAIDTLNEFAAADFYFLLTGVTGARLDAEAGEGDVVKLYWSYLARTHCGWRNMPDGYGPHDSMIGCLETPDGYTGSATIFLSVPRAFVFDEDYVLSDITVVQFREVTDTAAVVFPYEETLRLTEVLRKKLGSEISSGIESEITAIENALKKIQDAAEETGEIDQEAARGLYERMYALVKEHYKDYVIDAWVVIPATITDPDYRGAVKLEAVLSNTDGPVALIFLKGNTATTFPDRPAET